MDKVIQTPAWLDEFSGKIDRGEIKSCEVEPASSLPLERFHRCCGECGVNRSLITLADIESNSPSLKSLLSSDNTKRLLNSWVADSSILLLTGGSVLDRSGVMAWVLKRLVTNETIKWFCWLNYYALSSKKDAYTAQTLAIDHVGPPLLPNKQLYDILLTRHENLLPTIMSVRTMSGVVMPDIKELKITTTTLNLEA